MTTGIEAQLESALVHPPNTPHALGSVTAALYGQAATQGSILRAELLRRVEVSTELGEQAICRLLRLGLLTSATDEPERLIAVAPATAYAHILMPAIREIRAQQALIDDVGAELSALLPVYEDSALKKGQGHPLHRLDNVAAVRRAVEELAARATREVLTCLPGGPYPEYVLDESRRNALEVLERGVALRTLYQYAAQFHQPTADYVSALANHGGEVRLFNDAFPRLVVFDEQVAVIELVDNDEGALVIRDESVVHVLVRSFRRVWDKATPFTTSYDRGQVLRTSEELKMAIVELLAEGYDDKVVARRLGISLRTFQRHLAEVLRRIGAKNRLHAGYLIRDLVAPAEAGERRRLAGWQG